MVYQRVKLGVPRENRPDRLRHLFYFTLSFRMGFIAVKLSLMSSSGWNVN